MTGYWSVPRGAWKGEPAFILGGGPSLKGFDVSRLKGRGRVIAVNDAGLVLAPWADVLFWADARWYEWNKGSLHLHTGQWKVTRLCTPRAPGIHVLGHHRTTGLSTKATLLAGYCGGGSSINLAYLLGANPIILLGFDMRPGNWHDRHRLPHKPGQHRQRFIPAIERMAESLERAGATVLNCNPRSALRCFPFADIEELLALDDLAAVEREKYLKVWQREEYRKVSPGMQECERAFTVLGMYQGESLIDYGAGTGRATDWFRSQGLSVVAVDHVPNAIEFPDVPFVEASLWALPESLEPSDWGFCCDVLEHIPPKKVADVMQAIADRSRKGAWLRIATRPDRMGPRILGSPLHLTVRSGEWWRREAERAFPIVDVVSADAKDVVLACQK